MLTEFDRLAKPLTARFNIAYGVVRDLNDAMRSLTGFDSAELRGSNGAAFVHPEDRGTYISTLQVAIADGHGTAEVRVLDAVGRSHSARLSASVTDHEQRSVEVALELVAANAGERAAGPELPVLDRSTITTGHLPKILRQLRLQPYEPTLTLPSVSMLLVSRDWVVQQVEADRDSTWASRVLHAHLWTELPELPPTARDALEQAMRERRTAVTTFHLPTFNRAFSLSALPVRDDLALVVRDITATELQHHDLLRESHRALERDKLLHAVRDPIVTITLNGLVTFWNRAAERTFGFTSEEALGQRLITLLRVRISSFPGIAAFIQLQHWSGEIEMHSRDGRPVLTDARAEIMTDSAGTPEQIAIVYTDVTARQHAVRQQRQQDRLNSVAMLASGVTHDLNSVFTPILLASQILQATSPSAHSTALLNAIEQSAERGARMVQRVLAAARQEPTQRVCIDVRHLLEQVLDYGQTTLPSTIRLELHASGPLPHLQADREQLLQVLVNLVNNAKEAITAPGTISLSAEVASTDDALLISVGDTGSGIDDTMLQAIFEPFFSTKAAGWGTGLGLAASRAIAEDHGGHLTVHSAIGLGSTFTLQLPTVHTCPDSDDDPTPGTLPHSPATADEGHGDIVLIATAEADTGFTVRAALESARYRCLLAADVTGCVDWVESVPAIALLIADDSLIAALPTRPRIPTVLINNGRADEVTEPCTAVLARPFTSAQLQNVADTALRRQ